MEERPYLYDLFTMMCTRRGKTINRWDSVNFNVRVDFGLATNTYLLPAVANTFYFAKFLISININVAGAPNLTLLPNSGQGSAGGINIYFASLQYNEIELDSLQYVVGTHSAGSFLMFGQVYKILMNP